MALEAMETTSGGGVSQTGRAPTPIPMSACTGIFAAPTQAFVNVIARARVHGIDLLVAVVMAGPKIVTPAF